MLRYEENIKLDKISLINLYEDAGWTAYTKSPSDLIDAINNSLFILSVWNQNILVGLIRVVGDGVSIIFIQDILVLKEYKRQRIGTTLTRKVLEKFKNTRSILLLTEETQATRKFYESLGFESCDKGKLVTFIKSW